MPTRPRRLLVATLLAAFSSALARADSAPLSLDQALKNFDSAPPSAAPATYSGRIESDGGSVTAELRRRSAVGDFAEWRDTRSQLAGLQNYFDNQDYANALRQARQYARQANDPEVRARWNDLVAALEAEQKRVEDAAIEKLQAALALAGDAAFAARKPADLDATLDQLATLQESRSVHTPRVQRAYSRVGNATSFLQQWQDMLASLESGERDQARQQLRNLSSNSWRDRPLARSRILEFSVAAGLAEETLAAATARIDPVLARAVEIAFAPASRAADLDPILADIESLRADYENTYNSPLRRARDRLNDAGNFFRLWQDYLAARETGDLRDARQQLRNLAANSYTHRPAPRARIVALSASLAADLASETDTLLASLDWKTLPVVRERVALAQENANGRQHAELGRVLSELDRLAAARAALASGQPGVARTILTPPASALAAAPLPAALSALRETCWLELAPVLAGEPALPAPAPAKTAAAYLHRHYEAALAAADWPRALRLARAERAVLAPAPLPELDAAVASLAAHLRAEKLHRHGQPRSAAALWREALTADTPPALEAAIAERLSLIIDPDA